MGKEKKNCQNCPDFVPELSEGLQNRPPSAEPRRGRGGSR